MSFKDIENIECRVNNKLQTFNIAVTNRLKILKFFSIHNERIKIHIIMNEWFNIDNSQFIDFHICYQEIEYNVDVPSKHTSSPIYSKESTVLPNYDLIQ